MGTARLHMLVLSAALITSMSVNAGDHVYRADNAQWKAECGSCHVAYPPALLSAANWSAIMAQLDRHFGTDASIDAPAGREISDFLQTHAAQRKRHHDTARGALPRITETAWFKKEHDEIATATWASPAVKTAANCTACHRQAERGDFSERTLQVPR